MFTSDAAYDNFMGRFSTRLAPLFADFAGIAGGEQVLDVGAGTGALTRELVLRSEAVAAVDPSPQFVAALHERFPDVDAREAPAEQLPWQDGSFDAALAQLVVAFMQDAPAGIAEMHRVVRRGGVVAACMWETDAMELLNAVNHTRAAITPDLTFDASRYRNPDAIGELFGADAEVDRLTVEAGYSGFDELWDSLLGGAGPAGAWIHSLSESQQDAARSELRRQVGEPDGPFSLTGTAWAARVTRA